MLINQNVQSQELNLKSFTWKKRVLLIISDDAMNEKCRGQIKELFNNEEGIKERKLLIIEVHKKRYRVIDDNKKWYLSHSLYEKYANINDSFQIILIGLDGGIKMREFNIMEAEDIFREIDSMPMRKSELRQIGNQK